MPPARQISYVKIAPGHGMARGLTLIYHSLPKELVNEAAFLDRTRVPSETSRARDPTSACMHRQPCECKFGHAGFFAWTES